MHSETAHRKVTASHLQRDAYLYVRQSSMGQVLNNQESARLQYDLRRQAIALGWHDEQIRVIDCYQGESSAVKDSRDGFQELVVDVSMQRAGIVMGREVSTAHAQRPSAGRTAQQSPPRRTEDSAAHKAGLRPARTGRARPGQTGPMLAPSSMRSLGSGALKAL